MKVKEYFMFDCIKINYNKYSKQDFIDNVRINFSN